ALSGSQLSGRVANNTIGTSGVPFSGSKGGNGIFVVGAGGGTMTFDITGNQIRQYAGNAAIYADNTGGSYTANFTIRNNLAAEPGVLAFTGLALTNGAPGSSDTINVCADIRNNDFSAAAPGILSDIMVAASGAATGHTFNLPGLPQPPTLSGVQEFIRD